MNNRINYLMAKYQESITRLRMLRPDLDEKTIVDEVQHIASSNLNCTVLSVLRGCIHDAAQALKMPWETDNSPCSGHEGSCR